MATSTRIIRSIVRKSPRWRPRFIALSERVLGRLARGEIDRILLDGTEGGIIVVPAGREAALATMVGKDAKLGLVMHEARRAANRVQEVLARKTIGPQ